MKFNQFSKKEQEIRSYLLADAFGSFYGIGLETSVLNTIPGKMPNVNGNTGIEKALHILSMSIREVLVIDSYTSHIV
ncbi:hypothetical protein [Aquimarina sp. 2201CG14-23]|uniref:hypothetical protein n=1 Tax=Aquimarina mycalae TaxID=3040073 RepID=UPI0024780194|nr:hypothetical protein [Aquimarina sp. 2201CG14-23]MDH7447753.1 hypothetical protein [Aquimarina sp. 2201CG14-23]